MTVNTTVPAILIVCAFVGGLDRVAIRAESPSLDRNLEWKPLPNLPNELGVAGPFVGVHSDALIVAGGANFPRPVWETQKNWTDEVWVLTKTETKGELAWCSGGRLERSIAYGAAVSTSQGVICIGGSDQQRLYSDVFSLQWDATQRQVVRTELPPLPIPFTNGQATAIDEVIYVACGQSEVQLTSAMNSLWSLDLSASGDPDQFRWKPLPALPARGRAFNITAYQSNGSVDCIYVIGGRYQDGSEVKFLKDVWEFNVKQSIWRRRADAPRCVVAGTGIGFASDEILVLSGDDGSLYAQIDVLKDQHPGFLREAFAYNTIADNWRRVGATPMNQVTTIPVIWDDCIILASGEVRPRVRTSAVWTVSQTASAGNN